ncbi:uncharacterized protein (DUF58 family) [Luteimonas cucumeris]|uniref:Uncharacterized protein (DUF58 family) n=2 Tax=Luteimonas cucumeris TaxID=985012 RepID=A0A562L718_9GAMM|nr:uncharacterized protein (DUF58 family) [Luteimonas cucumeris]
MTRFDRLRRMAEVWTRPRAPETLPVALGRQRVYVLPTRFGLFFAVLVFAMGLGALNYNNNPALLLALLLAGTAMASLITAHLQLSGLVIDTVSAEPVPAGEFLSLRLRASARDLRLRRGLKVGYEDATAMLSLDQGSEAALSLPTERRGWLDLDRIRISTLRPLGLATAWAWVWPEQALLVYPAPETHGPPLPTDVSDSGVARLNPAGDDVHHLRSYRRGDPQRAVAWKPSARRDTLLVREYEQPRSAEVILDWQRLGPLAYEHRIRRLAHWIDQAERENRRYQLRLPGQPVLGPAQGSTHRHACLRALALLPHVDAA